MNTYDRPAARLVQPQWHDLFPDSADFNLFDETSAALEAGSLVRCLRMRADMSAAVLAEMVGLSEARISQIENAEGRDVPTYQLLRRVAEACGVNLTELLITALAPAE